MPGAFYPDGTSGNLKKDDWVPPGGSYTYRWEVKPEFAPTKDDANCLTWIYHSHTDAPMDIASGLIGALLTCKKGTNTFDHMIFNLTEGVFLTEFHIFPALCMHDLCAKSNLFLDPKPVIVSFRESFFALLEQLPRKAYQENQRQWETRSKQGLIVLLFFERRSLEGD